MATVSAQMVKELRVRTGAGMMECKQALSETDGDAEKAIDLLRKKGIAKAAKKSGRETAEGGIGTYVHAGGKIGVMVEVNCETDFVANTDEFKSFLRDIAMHIAGASPAPQVVSREELSADILERERAIFMAQAAESGKPENVMEKMVEGRINKFMAEVTLLDQPFVKNPDIKVSELLTQQVTKLGENMTIRRFVRYQLGEG